MGKRKSPDGEATSDLIQSVHIGSNADQFPEILCLHVPPGAVIADVTYGKGIFWKNVNLQANNYELRATDIDDGVDCRDLPYADGEIDCLVLDPPYMEGFYRDNDSHKAGSGSYRQLGEYYSSGTEGGEVKDKKWQRTGQSGNYLIPLLLLYLLYSLGVPLWGVAVAGLWYFGLLYSEDKGWSRVNKWQEVVHEMYYDSAVEAHRVLKKKGIFIVKCQDAVSAGNQHLTHVKIINFCEQVLNFYTKDLFVLVRSNKASASTLNNQVHARKKHSYWLIFVKR